MPDFNIKQFKSLSTDTAVDTKQKDVRCLWQPTDFVHHLMLVMNHIHVLPVHDVLLCASNLSLG